MKKFFILLLISACTSYPNSDIKTKFIDFNEDLDFNEYEKLLNVYNKSNGYQKLD